MKRMKKRNKGFLAIKPIKAPHDLEHIQEYICNNGFYFANCAWPHRINSDCEYIKHGCTGCLSKIDYSYIELSSILFKAIVNIKKLLKARKVK